MICHKCDRCGRIIHAGAEYYEANIGKRSVDKRENGFSIVREYEDNVCHYDLCDSCMYMIQHVLAGGEIERLT